MVDYIERKAASDAACAALTLIPPAAREALKVAIDKVPPADVRPVVRGRWKYFHKQNKAVCTVCSFERDLDQNFGAAIACPNCGADMRGE